MDDIYDFDHMEMPAPCSRCGDVQELDDYRALPAGGELVCDVCWDIEERQDPDEYHDRCVDMEVLDG